MLENSKDNFYGDLLEIAKTTQDIAVLDELKSNKDPVIRKAVARNSNTPSQILNFMQYDPVLNVSYMVQQNPNFNTNREFEDISHPCVGCLEDERYRDCDSCKIMKEYYGIDK